MTPLLNMLLTSAELRVIGNIALWTKHKAALEMTTRLHELHQYGSARWCSLIASEWMSQSWVCSILMNKLSSDTWVMSIYSEVLWELLSETS